jgi:hypothetical protein
MHTDILNPVQQGFQPDIQDNMNPNYGFTRKRPMTKLNKKAVGGTPWSRETSNTGHSFELSWIARSRLCAQRIKYFYEQFEDGFFTYIDWDGGGRHYVGRFTTEPVLVQTSNGKWDVQQVVFEEIPRVAMVQYPNDWDHDAIKVGVLNDFGDVKLATSGTWAQVNNAMVDPDSGDDSNYVTMQNAGTAGEWAQYEYRGYGVRLYLMSGPAFGQANVLIDGVQVATIDCYAAQNRGPSLVFEKEDLSLDFHRVKVMPTGNKNAAASAASIAWAYMQVMR